jgi:hypothetical protein
MSDNYFIENKETGKIELHFEKSAYMALSEDQKRNIKSNYLFSRYSSAWVSRCKFPNLSYARRVAVELGLEDRGSTGERLSFQEQQEQKIERAERRADYYDYKSDKAEKEAERLQKPINDMHGDISFFTQPNINSSAGRAFTNRRNRMWESWERGMDEFRKSAYYQDRAETARRAAEKPSKDFCQRRIDEAQSSIRKLTANIKEYENYLEKLEKGEKLVNKYGWEVNQDRESLESNIERWNDMLENAIGKAAYYDALIQEQGGVQFSKENIKPGYIVKLNRSWKGAVLVTSCGPKNIRYKDVDGSGFELAASYAEITEIIKASESNEIRHPFKVGEKFTVKAWNGSEYADKEFEITKVTPDKVTVKAGTERAKAIKVRQSYRGDSYYLAVENGYQGSYSKAI